MDCKAIFETWERRRAGWGVIRSPLADRQVAAGEDSELVAAVDPGTAVHQVIRPTGVGAGHEPGLVGVADDGADEAGELQVDVVVDLSPDLQVAVAIAYAFGWRMQSEVLTLERRQLDPEAGTLRLGPGTTKNDEGRLVYLTPELKSLLATRVGRVRTLERQTGRIIPHLFPHLRGPHKGERRRDLRKTWATVCRNAGCPRMLRHDFRRSASGTWSTLASLSGLP